MLITLLLSVFTFVQLNGENLFDTLPDTILQDSVYTPSSERRWTRSRYWKKLDAIGRVVISCGGDTAAWSLPDMVALCEVENDSVMGDLTRRSLLRRAGYEYVMTSSPDRRGIDVALMYSPASFAMIRHYPLRVTPLKDMRPTRDILYACGVMAGGDTLHVFVVHAPSRYGGERRTRDHRLQVMRRLRLSVDSLRAVHDDPLIIVAGDMNDYAGSPSLVFLRDSCALTDVSADARGSHGAKGTYKYNGVWGSLDHILVSGPMTGRVADCRVGDAPFLLEPDKKYGGVKPFRTYNGYRYQGGYSDHLPLILRLSTE